MIDFEKTYAFEDLTLIPTLSAQQTLPQNTHLLAADLQAEIMRVITQQEEKEIAGKPLLRTLTEDLENLLVNLDLAAKHSQAQ